MKATSDETWAAVPGFEGYEVSTAGRVRSYRNCGRLHDPGKRVDFSRPPRIVRDRLNGNGYPIVTLRMGAGNPITRSVHRLVLEAFVGPAPKGQPHCAHGNGVRDDNRLQNLRWASPRENFGDKVLHGTNLFGAAVKGSKLRPESIQEIFEMAGRGAKQREIAAAFGIARATVAKILLRMRWKHIDTGIEPGQYRVSGADTSEMARLHREGLTYAMIAKKFGVCVNTVGNHVRNNQ